MKKTVITLLLAIVTLTAAAENNDAKLLRLGIGAGMTNASLDVPDKTLMDEAGTGYFMKLSLKFNVPVLPIYIQPEAQYSFMDSFDPMELKDITLKKLDFPIMVGAQIGSGRILGLRLNAGPVFNVSSSADEESLPVRWAAGAGVDLLNKITLDLRYHGCFKDSDFPNVDFNYWSYSIGFMF
ncbi:MAG: porin family protein [Tidjanibacter sp.]|nr:porin family protein [Tidjanibacter sp.]